MWVTLTILSSYKRVELGPWHRLLGLHSCSDPHNHCILLSQIIWSYLLIINRHSIVILHFLIHAMALAAQHTHCSFSFQSFISSMIRRRPAMSGRLRGGVRKRTLWSCLQSSYFCSLFAAHHSRPCPANVSKGCWRGDAILREVKSSAGTVEFCHQRRQGFYKEVALYLIIRKPLFQIKVKKVSRWVPAWTQNARFTSGACPTMPTSKTSFTLRYFFPLRSSFI